MKKGTRWREGRKLDEKAGRTKTERNEEEEGSETELGEKERKKGGERERGGGNLALSRRLLSVWPALPALRAPDGTLLKFIDNHKFRK